MSQDLKKLRSMADLTQCDVAKQSGVDRSKLSLAENGYATLRPEEEEAIRKVLLDQIEKIEYRAAQLRGALSGKERETQHAATSIAL